MAKFHLSTNCVKPIWLNSNKAAFMLVLLWLPAQSQAFEKHRCTANWYKQSISASHEKSPDRVTECQKTNSETKQLGWYWVVSGKAYWLYDNKERHSPCSGTGPGALGQIGDPVCWLPQSLQIHENEEYRNFYLVSQDGENFKLANTKVKNLKPWQKSRVTRYATDNTSVYLNSEKIGNADPKSFEVLFPFGDDPKWDLYSFAKDDKHLFVDGWIIPNIDLSKVEWQNLPCSDPANNCDTTYEPPRIGKVGRDVLFLHYGSRPTVFRDLAKEDLACSRREYSGYCFSGGKLYKIVSDFDEEAKLFLEDAEKTRTITTK